MNTLGGIDLPEGLVWSESGQAQGRRTALRTALDGTPVVFAGAAPQRVTLTSGDDHGWFDEVTAAALLDLAESSPTAVLVWADPLRPTATRAAAFDHESAPAVQMEPLWPGCAVYTGRIALILID
ncbi:MAG: hypothetical protein KIS62_12465 [Ramlibacter sp.]|nr:hypothetical protein [Ramlibacter sp.]